MKWLMLLPVALILPCEYLSAQSNALNALRPDFIRLQFAGNTGLISCGIGYKLFNRKLNVSVLDGYVPGGIATVRAINTANLRVSYDLLRVPLLAKAAIIPYAGATAMFETSGHGYYGRAEGFPKGYYKYTALHALFFGGAKLSLPLSERGNTLELYAETGTVDSYLYLVARNGGRGLVSIFSAALGLQYQFAPKAR